MLKRFDVTTELVEEFLKCSIKHPTKESIAQRSLDKCKSLEDLFGLIVNVDGGGVAVISVTRYSDLSIETQANLKKKYDLDLDVENIILGVTNFPTLEYLSFTIMKDFSLENIKTKPLPIENTNSAYRILI